MRNGLRSNEVKAMSKEIQVHKSSGSVFVDLGLPDAEEALAKARLAQSIAGAIARKRLTQVQAASVLGIDQPKVSALLRGRLTGFSTNRLFRFLTLLDQDVEIVIRSKPRSRKHGKVSVVAA